MSGGGIYWWTLAALAVGVLAGFQGIYNRYPLESISLLSAPPGLLYLATRGLVPSATYCAIVASRQSIPIPPPLFALCLGVGVELVLRMRFFVRENTKADGGTSELMFGPFNLLKWYQDWFLTRLGVYVGDVRKECVNTLLPEDKSFLELCELIDDRRDLLQADQKAEVNKVVARHKKLFADGKIPDPRAKVRLALALLNVVGKRELSQLIK